ncbi:MAG: DUF3047 domain-containing protein [Deltaproteobacteria bacterium]|nr:DUF3047 domain-containing protein [Deltaproteobacteria bacterium]
MKLRLSLFACVFICSLGCASPERTAVLVPDGSSPFPLMDFSDPPSIDPPTPGWYHRTFRRHPPMEISFVSKDDRPAIRLSTNDSASMLFRWVDVDLARYPTLSWSWFIEQTIESEEDEMTVAGDDHPARLYLKFESADGEEHSMEIIWGNRVLHRGDWKHLEFLMGLFSFPHYTANGGHENAGRWHRERVNLSELYTTLWGDVEGAHLLALALFCDSDETGAQSTAYFADIRVETEP